MRYFKLLQERSKFFYFFLIIVGLINSVWASALLIFINDKITGTPLPFFPEYDWIIYSTLIVVSFFLAKYFQSYMIKLSYNLGNQLGLSVFNKLRFSNYEEYQKLGEERVRTLINDVSTLQNFPRAFMETFNSAVMIIIGIVYLLWVNLYGALIITSVIVVLATVYFVRNLSIEKDLYKARDLANSYMANVNDFLLGFREVKTSIERSDIIYNEYLTKNRTNVKNLTIKSMTKYLVNDLLGNYAWYLIIGIILFLLPFIITSASIVNVNFIVTLLYLMGPVTILVSEISVFTNLKIAMGRVDEFNNILNSSRAIEIGHGKTAEINKEFKSIRFENVSYEYYDEKKDKTFRLQPINLEIKKGECIFITGGNGSGKSTFINLLTGLYMPLSGTIYLNDHKINAENYPYFRNQISSIFADAYLFKENYNNFELNEQNEKLKHLINKMQLTDILKLDGKKNNIKTTLSKGQQKRLALIYAVLENKDILVLDEWAAEQDPGFREYFYKDFIQELKEKGKTIIAVTHDDKYFDFAGRIINFDYGRIAFDKKINKIEAKVNTY